MKLKIPSRIALTEYRVAPWYVRVRWWLEARLWCWGKSIEECGADSPAQVNPLWKKW